VRDDGETLKMELDIETGSVNADVVTVVGAAGVEERAATEVVEASTVVALTVESLPGSMEQQNPPTPVGVVSTHPVDATPSPPPLKAQNACTRQLPQHTM
jgi:hypothetical protein